MDISSDALEAFVEGNMDFGMTHEQIKNFVVNSHVTNRRKLRQVLVEVSTRNHERKKLRLDIERKQVKIDELTARLETVDDPYERRFIEIDIEEYKLDMGRFRITLHQADNELQAFMDWIHKNYGEMDEVVQDAEYNEEDVGEFIAYWLGRPNALFSEFQWTQKFAYTMKRKRVASGYEPTRKIGSQQVKVAPGIEADDNARKLVEKYATSTKKS